MLVGLGVRVDADHVGSGAGEDVRAVSLPAGEVGDALPTTALGDPLVHGEVPPEPVVLLRQVGEGALAGERQRGHPVGLVLLHVLQAGAI